MPNEEQARVRINALLENAGYSLNGGGGANSETGSVGYERDIRHQPMRKRILGKSGKIPDYHLYPPKSNIPIAFIEAKRAGRSLNGALQQSLETARVATNSDTPNLVLFSSDGIQVKCMHGRNQEPCYINNSVVDYFPPIALLRSLLEEPKVETGEKITAVRQIIRLFEDASDAMRRDGIDAGIDQLREFSRFLFMKIMSERGHQKSIALWSQLKHAAGNRLLSKYREALRYYEEEYGEIFSKREINQPETIENLVGRLDPVNFTNSGLDLKGEAFEFFLSSYSAGNRSVLGQYFTPRHITRLIAQILDPKPGDKIVDPFCGTGGMLISCFNHIRDQFDRNDPDFTSKDRELKKHTLYGIDISAGASSLAKMNMILLGDGHTNIFKRDSLKEIETGKFDKLITNIPFNLSGRIDQYAYAQYYKMSGLNRLDWNEICVIRCVESIKSGGALAMIVPWTICSAPRYQDIRDYIARKSSIRCVLRLPEKTFIRYTTAQTAVYVLGNLHQQSTREFTLVHIKSDGMSQDTWREPIDNNELPDVIEHLTDDFLSIANYPGAEVIEHKAGKNSMAPASRYSETSMKYWRLDDLLNIKNEPYDLQPDKSYATPRLSSSDNSVTANNNLRLGRNFKGKKILARKGDLIIATLHTNRGNGLFAIADREYVCTSQLVAEINTSIVPLNWLIECLRVAFPSQLIPSDLVGRETFSADQILDVRIPQPHSMKQARALDRDLIKLKQQVDKKRSEVRAAIPSFPAKETEVITTG